MNHAKEYPPCPHVMGYDPKAAERHAAGDALLRDVFGVLNRPDVEPVKKHRRRRNAE